MDLQQPLRSWHQAPNRRRRQSQDRFLASASATGGRWLLARRWPIGWPGATVGLVPHGLAGVEEADGHGQPIAGRGGRRAQARRRSLGADALAGRWGVRWTLRRSLDAEAFAGRGGGEDASLRISALGQIRRGPWRRGAGRGGQGGGSCDRAHDLNVAVVGNLASHQTLPLAHTSVPVSGFGTAALALASCGPMAVGPGRAVPRLPGPGRHWLCCVARGSRRPNRHWLA
jgi:hypothetical protein